MKATLIANSNQNRRAESHLFAYGHSLQLAVGDMINGVRNLKDALDTTFEISKQVEFSPKREALFQKFKEDFAPEFPGFRTQCPTRCTVRGGSLKSVIDNWNVLQEVWDECLETKLEPDIKGRIIGVKYQMGTSDYFYGVNLGGMLFKHSENLSRAIQTSHMSSAEYQLVVALATKILTKTRIEEVFSLFWETCKKAAAELKINKLVLPRKRRCPIRYFLG